jgi:hypothetical protein
MGTNPKKTLSAQADRVFLLRADVSEGQVPALGRGRKTTSG